MSLPLVGFSEGSSIANGRLETEERSNIKALVNFSYMESFPIPIQTMNNILITLHIYQEGQEQQL